MKTRGWFCPSLNEFSESREVSFIIAWCPGGKLGTNSLFFPKMDLLTADSWRQINPGGVFGLGELHGVVRDDLLGAASSLVICSSSLELCVVLSAPAVGAACPASSTSDFLVPALAWSRWWDWFCRQERGGHTALQQLLSIRQGQDH